MTRKGDMPFARRSTVLATAARDGDDAAFAALLALWHPRLLAFARRKAGGDAEDVLQAASLTLAQNVDRLADPSRFGAFAMTIVARRAADWVDRAVRERRRRDALALQPGAPPADPDRQLALRQALSRLDPELRTLLTLHHVEGLTGPELADLLGLPLGTVKSRLHAARKRLRAIYDGDEP